MRPCTHVVIGLRSNMAHQRSRHISGMPWRTVSQVPSKAASSSSGVPQSSWPARAFGDSNTATWLNISPPRSGYCTKWHRGPM